MLSDLISTLKHIGIQANLQRVCDGISFDAWKEEDHPRGNPNNAGQFAKKGSAIHRSPLSRQCERAASMRAQVRAQKTLEEIGGTSVGSAMAKDFKDNGHANLVGRKVSNASDLAAIANVFRNPSFETFRFFFVKDGKVVHQVGVTSRLPSHTTAVNKAVLADIDAGIARVGGADGFYCLHNHPSGNVTPSNLDVRLTKQIADRFPERLNGIKMLGHVIIDHGKYSVINSDGAVQNDLKLISPGKDFKEGEKEQDCPLLGAVAKSPAEIAEIATKMQSLCANGDDVQIVATDNLNKTTGLASCSMRNLLGKSVAELGDIMRRYAISCTGANCAIVVDKNKLSKTDNAKLEDCIRMGIFIDVVYRGESKGMRHEKDIGSGKFEFGIPVGVSLQTDEIIRPA